ncbi:sigma-70 family RNA polymerase sigma factor [Saprospiraceae bacterium]|nr:sigma-70 family RNA polymerase sigma factor [Saprospiraceae bacterium]
MSQQKKYSKSQIRSLLSGIKRGGSAGQKAMETIYKDYRYMNYLKQIALDYKLDHSESADLLHDAIIIFRRNVKKGAFDGKTSIQTYITSIVKNNIQNHKRLLKNNTVGIANAMESPSIVEESVADFYSRKESGEKINELMSLISVECRKVLRMWQESYNYDEIAEEMNFSTRANAKTHKYRCMKKLMEHVSSFPHLKTFLS